MTSNTTKPDSLQPAAEMAVDLFDNWFDPIETEVRAQRTTNAIERLHEELDQDADRAAVGRYRRDVVLGAACLRSDQHAQGMAGRRSPQNPSISRLTRSLKRYLHVTGDRATPNFNSIPDGTVRHRGAW